VHFQFCRNFVDLVLRETDILPQTRHSIWAIQVDDGFMPLPNNVYVRRRMIVRVDYDAQTPQSQDGRHGKRVSQT